MTLIAQPFVTSGTSGPATPPTGGELVMAGAIVVLLCIGGLVGLRAAWTMTPEELDARPGFSRMRAGVGGLGGLIGLPLLFLYLLVFAATGEEGGAIQMLLGGLGTLAVVTGAAYVIAYYWIRFPDRLLPPPQRGRGGQWNGPDGKPAR